MILPDDESSSTESTTLPHTKVPVSKFAAAFLPMEHS